MYIYSTEKEIIIDGDFEKVPIEIVKIATELNTLIKDKKVIVQHCIFECPHRDPFSEPVNVDFIKHDKIKVCTICKGLGVADYYLLDTSKDDGLSLERGVCPDCMQHN